MEGSQPTNPAPSENAVKRYKILWRVFLIFNFALGGYIFTQAGASKKERGKEKVEVPAKAVSAPVVETAAPVQEKPVEVTPPVDMPEIVRQPILEDQQRELFKWMLEEKRKVKPQNREEKKRIDEEKAILKEFIRAKSIPKI